MESFFIKTEKQRKMIKKVNSLVPRFQEREYLLDEKGSFPYQNIQDLIDIGYTKLSLPTIYDGDNISAYDLVLYQENIAKGDGSTALSIGWHMSTLIAMRGERSWPKELYDYVCEKVQHGALINYVLSERGQGSPTRGARLQTVAKKAPAGWEITGRKSFATMAPALDYMIISALVEEGGEEREAFFLVPSKCEGVSIDEVWDSVALRGTASHDIVFHQVVIPENFLVDQTSVPETVKRSTGGLLHVPACYLGIAQAAYEYALDFALHYTPGNRKQPIFHATHIKERIGRIQLLLAQSRHLLYSVAEKFDGLDDKEVLYPHLAAAKYTVTNHALDIVDLAMRVTGARSLSEKNPLQRYYTNVRAGLHNPPADDEILNMLAMSVV
ncbi:acyl-CoA dehydrogenase [Cerasibacillus terrae]|uniref:Acyl-CoA dehydrogenase n=1 Tax=Cerasibacillus terrae TaxID=2498845 RepID=A0A5C8NUR8_9BACI|nr:acyl-CoA dehydrogenase family protein [Cerasibacillus terrae]TXL64923.1 acyl-CoA dehydrogenase [Cerasibacillus terrae]